jgi:hypothetical protein
MSDEKCGAVKSLILNEYVCELPRGHVGKHEMTLEWVRTKRRGKRVDHPTRVVAWD